MWVLWFLFKLVPSRQMSNKEEKVKALGEKSEKNERNRRHQPAQTDIFCVVEKKKKKKKKHLGNQMPKK